MWHLPATLALSAALSIATLQPVAMVKIGKTADWVAITPDAVWVGSTGPNAVHHIDPRTNTEAAAVAVTDYHKGTLTRLRLEDALAR